MAPVCNGSTNTAGSRGGRPAFKGPPARPGPFQAPHAHHCRGHGGGDPLKSFSYLKRAQTLGIKSLTEAPPSRSPNIFQSGVEYGKYENGSKVRLLLVLLVALSGACFLAARLAFFFFITASRLQTRSSALACSLELSDRFPTF